MNLNQRLEQTKLLTRYFGEMQGLRIVPIGVFLVLDAGFVWLMRTDLVTEQLQLVVLLGFAVLSVLLLVAWNWTNHYYLRQFGSVQIESIAAKIWPKTALIVIMLSTVLLDVFLKPPILLSGLVFSGLIWAGLTQLGKARKDYLWAAVAVFLTTFLPIVGLDRWLSIDLFLAMLGMVMILAGLLDHAKLEQLFKQQEPIHDRS